MLRCAIVTKETAVATEYGWQKPVATPSVAEFTRYMAEPVTFYEETK